LSAVGLVSAIAYETVGPRVYRRSPDLVAAAFHEAGDARCHRAGVSSCAVVAPSAADWGGPAEGHRPQAGELWKFAIRRLSAAVGFWGLSRNFLLNQSIAGFEPRADAPGPLRYAAGVMCDCVSYAIGQQDLSL
jgi:hypothetical protein